MVHLKTTESYAYESEKEMHKHELKMTREGYVVVEFRHENWKYYREYAVEPNRVIW